jgi:putative hydrolase of the HAD superfamily
MMKLYDKKAFASAPDAVLFDMDNTFYAYDPANEAAHASVREKAARIFSIRPADFDEAFAEARRQIKERLSGTASSHSRLLYFQRLLEIMGLGSQILYALDFEQTYWRVFLSNAKLFDGVKEVLDELRLLGIPMAMVTDLTVQIQFRKIAFFELDKFFDCVVSSEEAGFDKPHPAPFRMALDKLRPKGKRVWMIGDSPDNDIGGAKKAIGALTLQKIHKGVTPGAAENAPDATFAEFEQLLRLVQSLKP